MPTPPDPRTAPDDNDAAEEIANDGVSATQPAEGADDEPADQPGSPEG